MSVHIKPCCAVCKHSIFTEDDLPDFMPCTEIPQPCTVSTRFEYCRKIGLNVIPTGGTDCRYFNRDAAK